MIPESQDWVPCQAFCSAGNLLIPQPFPCSLCLCFSPSNKIFRKIIHVQIFHLDRFSFHVAIYWQIKLLGQMVTLCWAYFKNARSFHRLLHFISPQQCIRVPTCPDLSNACDCLFGFIQSKMYKVVKYFSLVHQNYKVFCIIYSANIEYFIYFFICWANYILG